MLKSKISLGTLKTSVLTLKIGFPASRISMQTLKTNMRTPRISSWLMTSRKRTRTSDCPTTTRSKSTRATMSRYPARLPETAADAEPEPEAATGVERIEKVDVEVHARIEPVGANCLQAVALVTSEYPTKHVDAEDRQAVELVIVEEQRASAPTIADLRTPVEAGAAVDAINVQQYLPLPHLVEELAQEEDNGQVTDNDKDERVSDDDDDEHILAYEEEDKQVPNDDEELAQYATVTGIAPHAEPNTRAARVDAEGYAPVEPFEAQEQQLVELDVEEGRPDDGQGGCRCCWVADSQGARRCPCGRPRQTRRRKGQLNLRDSKPMTPTWVTGKMMTQFFQTSRLEKRKLSSVLKMSSAMGCPCCGARTQQPMQTTMHMLSVHTRSREHRPHNGSPSQASRFHVQLGRTRTCQRRWRTSRRPTIRRWTYSCPRAR